MKKVMPWLSLILGIIFSTIIWGYISVPYDSSNTINGQYSLNKINPLNDTLRGLFFIFFPLSLYFITFIKFNKELITKKIFQSKNTLSNNNVDYLCIILIVFSFLEFYTLNYNNFLGSIDVHHEGTYLTAQLNFFSKKQIWTGTFFDYGFLGNSIGIFFNSIFDGYSIGIQRFFFKFLILFNKILIILICRKIVISTNLVNKKEILFLIFCLSSITLASFYENVTPFHPRIFIYLIFTLLICNIVTAKKSNFFMSFLTGFLSLFSILFYWDIGSYINILLIVLLAYLFIIKDYGDFYSIVLGILSTWVIFFIITPGEELKEFFNQYFIILNISDYLIGIEFPKPFSDKSTRHTKALLLIIFSGVFLINYIFDKLRKESLESKFLLFFIFISSILFLKSGLTRSDGPHIKYTSGQYTLLIFFFFSYYLINFTNNFKFFSKINFFFEKKAYFVFLSIIICYLFIFQNNYLSFLNIFNFSKNFQAITKIDDKKFLDNDYYEFIEIYKNLVKNENCVQQFTDDNAIPYLVGKPTCTKYYVNAHIIQNWTENNFIKELKDTAPTYIVYSSKINWFKNKQNAPNADKFILDNYSLFKDLAPWQIYKKKIN
jgi:hypothetical protein